MPELLKLDFSEPIYCAGFVISIGISILLLFKLLRPYFNKSVVCWFCHEPFSVPYGNRNCWDCPFCEQYNGFTKDGGYNKPIPSQHNEDLNYLLNCTEKVQQSKVETSNRLCETCTRNQTMKVRQLANFTPTNEARFDEEVEVYKARLERVYRLCFSCQQRVHDELRRQNELMRPKLMKHLQRSRRAISQLSSMHRKQGSTRLAMLLISSLKVALLTVISLSLYVALSPILGCLRIKSLAALYHVLKTHQIHFQLAGVIFQLISLFMHLLTERWQLRDFINCVLWLLCYGHAVLLQRLLLPTLLSYQIIPASLLTIILLSTCMEGGRRHLLPLESRSTSPSGSSTWGSVVSNQSDSGVSEGQPNIRDVMCDEFDAMDCTASELSSLNIGVSPSKSQFTYGRPATPAPFIRPSALSSGRSSYGGSVRSFRTAPSMYNGYSPPPHLSRAPSYSSLCPPTNSSPPPSLPSYDGIANHFSTSPSVSNYMSIGSSPDSPTSSIYSHASQRVAPEKTSLFTQIMLGLSLGVNISIGAFLLGRYSVNGDLLSFV
ncbi:transmembrane protein 201-like [Watersipora subatra]|uniref:transmembrane protein 201-like n=1 Tax=Watersipora subatra TaxID=2589382 RepID=UPI00355BC17E